MKPKVTSFLIADGAHAKVFKHEGPGTGLVALRDLMFEEEPLKARDIMADRQGRSFSSVGHGRSGYEYTTDPVDVREARFMKTMAERLDARLREGAFDRLVIAAAPEALGEIRPQLSKAVQDTIIGELPKDLTKMPTDKLASHFDGILAM